jgi:hypothetical protein
MEPLLYQPGDLVTIRSDLVGDRDYPVLYGPSAGNRTLYCNNDMVKYSGKTYEIENYADDDDFYMLKEIPWSWTESMFESPTECICNSLL